MPRAKKQSVENKVRDIRRKTRRKYSAEEKIRIVLEGLRGEQTVAEPSGSMKSGRVGELWGVADKWARIRGIFGN